MTAGAWSAVLGNIFNNNKKPPMKDRSNVVDWSTFRNESKNLNVDFNEYQSDYVNSIRIDHDTICHNGIEFKHMIDYVTVDGKVI